MRSTTAARVLIASLLLEVAAAKDGFTASRYLQNKLQGIGDASIKYHESFTVNETIPALGDSISLNFANSDFVKCELSATGPCTFSLSPDIQVAAEPARGEQGMSSILWGDCTTFRYEGALDRSKMSLFSVSNQEGRGPVRVTGGCTLTSKRRLRDSVSTGIQRKDGTTQTLKEVVEVAAASYVPFHFKQGVTTVAWNLSCVSCRDDESWFIYSLFETEQWLQLEASKIYDDDMDNDTPVRMACLYTYSDVRPDSTRAIPVDPSRRYTLVLFNTNEKPVKVSGSITTTSSK